MKVCKEGTEVRLTPVAAFESLIKPREAELLLFEFGEPSSQAILEAYAILRAIEYWKCHLQGRTMLIKGDSLVALTIAKKLASGTPTLIYLAAEIALRLERYKIGKLILHHVRGKDNVESDWLSRIHNRGPRPASLDKVDPKRIASWGAEQFWLPPPGLDKG